METQKHSSGLFVIIVTLLFQSGDLYKPLLEDVSTEPAVWTSSVH